MQRRESKVNLADILEYRLRKDCNEALLRRLVRVEARRFAPVPVPLTDYGSLDTSAPSSSTPPEVQS